MKNKIHLHRLKRQCGTFGLFAVLVMFSLSLGCKKSEDAGKKKPQEVPPVPVTVATAVSQDIPWIFDTYGIVEPFSSVNITSLVSGKVIKIGFVPGQKVKKGDILAQIDSRPYEANLKQFAANLERDKVLSSDAERQTSVKDELYKKKIVSEDEMFKTKAVSESLKRSVKINEANIDKARLDVEYCTIRTPFDGRVGDILIHEGAIIKINDDIIASVSTTSPAYVGLSLPERLLPVVQKLMADARKIEVVASVESSKGKIPNKGELCFIDNKVNQESGTIKMKVLFQNTDESLWPGQFVDVSIELSTGEPYTAIPSDAVQNGQLGLQVFVVKSDSTVELRQVEVERTNAGMSAISKGVQAGEMVVLTGQFRLVPGAKVAISSTESEKKTEPAPDKK